MTDNIQYSDLKIFLHPEKLKALSQGVVTAPIYVRIKPTNRCDHGCEYCSYRDEQSVTNTGFDMRDSIPFEKLREVIADCAAMGVRAVTFSGGGEPLLYPRIDEVMQLVLDKGIDLSLITHGQYLTGNNAKVLKHAKWVRVSMDSPDAKTYSRIRHVPEEVFISVSRNIREFAAAKAGPCELGVNFVVNKYNFSQVYAAAKYFRLLGVNHVKFSALYCGDIHAYHAGFRNEVISQIGRAIADFTGKTFKIVDKYSGDFEDADVVSREYHFCPIKEIVPVIAADSKVYFCHDKAFSADGAVGSIAGQSFRQLWFSGEAAARFRELDPSRDCRHHCTYHRRIQLINSFLELERNQAHANFI